MAFSIRDKAETLKLLETGGRLKHWQCSIICSQGKGTRVSMGAIQKGGISTGILATIAGVPLYWLLQPDFYYASFCKVIW